MVRAVQFPSTPRILPIMAFIASTSVLPALLLTAVQGDPSSTWQQVGDPGVYTFATSPDYASDGLAWIASGSVNYEGDGDFHLVTGHGESVQPLSSLPAVDRTQWLTVSPTFAVDGTLFATSVRDNMTPDSWLWKSTDGGSSWTQLPQPAALNWNSPFKTLALSPNFASDQVMLASPWGQTGQTQRSDDGGMSWTLNPFPTFTMRDITFADDFATSGFAYGIRVTTPTFHRSTDFGFVFKQCSHPLSNPGICAGLDRAWGIEAAPVGPQGERPIFYFGQGTAAAPQNLVRSMDNGSNWDLGTAPGSAPGSAGGGLEGLVVYDLVVADDGLGTGRVYAATDDGVYVSNDGGTSFSPLAGAGLPTPVTRIELAGGPDGDLYALAGGDPDPQYFEITTIGATQPGNLYRLRLSGTGVVDLGFALPGAAGAPALTASTTFGDTASLSLELSGAAPSAPTIQFFATSKLLAPILGGVLVPSPDNFVVTTTNASGASQLDLVWPAAVHPGLKVFFQAWTVDAGAPAGASASNGLELTKL